MDLTILLYSVWEMCLDRDTANVPYIVHSYSIPQHMLRTLELSIIPYIIKLLGPCLPNALNFSFSGPFLWHSQMKTFNLIKSCLTLLLICFFIVNFDIIKVIDFLCALFPCSPPGDDLFPRMTYIHNKSIKLFPLVFILIGQLYFLCTMYLLLIDQVLFLPLHVNLSTKNSFKNTNGITISMF